jgi:hypothetical protein
VSIRRESWWILRGPKEHRRAARAGVQVMNTIVVAMEDLVEADRK